MEAATMMGIGNNTQFQDGIKTSVVGIDLDASIKMSHACNTSELD